MESHELLQEVFQKCSAKQLAGELGLSLSMIYKWAEPDDGGGSGAANPLDRIETLVRCTHDARIVHWICERAGGFFIKNPKATWPHPIHLMPATKQIGQGIPDPLAAIATAAADNHITKKEDKNNRARWGEFKTVTQGFGRCGEESNFAR